MAIFLCTAHRGGVGKTTIAVHIAGILAGHYNNRVLVIDCDSQLDSFRFFTGERPDDDDTDLQEPSENISIIANRKRESVIYLTDTTEYDDIVFDIDSALPSTVEAIVHNFPDYILIPVKRDPYALEHVSDSLDIVIEGDILNFFPKVMVIPIGVSKKKIKEYIPSSYSRINLRIFRRIRNLNKIRDRALDEGNFIWSYNGAEDFLGYFHSLIAELRRM